jgi:ribosomal protein L11 methyltransferase
LKWQQIIIRTTHQAYPAASDFLQQLGVSGISKEKLESEDDELAVTAYIKDLPGQELVQKITAKLSSLKEYNLEVGSGKIEIAEVEDKDWTASWKENFHPVKLTDKIVVKPSWEDYQSKEGEIILEIDPGQAFGTGYHATTEGCLQLIEKYLTSRTSLLDVGTGTGILAIAAAKLGAKPITALDIDAKAVEVARENTQLNQVMADIEFKQGDLVAEINERYPFVVANILPEIILDLVPNLKEVMTQDGLAVLSGIIEEKEEQVKAKLSQHGFKIVDRIKKEEWVTLAVKT